MQVPAKPSGVKLGSIGITRETAAIANGTAAKSLLIGIHENENDAHDDGPDGLGSS